MQPFLNKLAYHNTIKAVNLARMIYKHDLLNEDNDSWEDVTIDELVLDCPGGFKQVVYAHALGGVELFHLPLKMGVTCAAAATGGFTLIGYAAMVLSGAGAELDFAQTRQRILLHRMANRGLIDFPVAADEIMKIVNDRYGILGRPEYLARNRAEKAYDAGQGLAHAAWTSLAIGLNALLWLPRTASAVLHQATTLVCAAIGACIGATFWASQTYEQNPATEPKTFVCPRTGRRILRIWSGSNPSSPPRTPHQNAPQAE